MRLTAFVLVLLGAAPVVAAQGVTARGGGAQAIEAPREIGAPLVLDVAVRLYGADRRLGSYAGDSDTKQLESYVWANETLCGMGASDTPPANSPWIAWHFKGNVVSSSSGLMVVRVEWQRIFEKGARLTNGPNGSQTVTIRDGERVELDRIAAASVGMCGAVEGRLEVSVVTPPAYLLGVARGASGGVRGSGVAGGRGGRGAGTGAAGGVSGVTVGGATGGVSRGTGSGKVIQVLPAFEKRLRFVVLAKTYDAELWLVHSKPDGIETVRPQTVRFGGLGGASVDYAFPSIQVATSQGVITLEITGNLQAFVGNEPGRGRTSFILMSPSAPGEVPAQRIVLSISRRAHAAGPPLLDITGGSSMVIDVPAPADVLSFEFPALQKAAEDLLKGHQFSLRVRVTPVAR